MLQIKSYPELHPLFEGLGYALGFVVYKRAEPISRDVVNNQQRWKLIAAAIIGGLLGSRLLGLIEQIPLSQLTLMQFFTPGGGKSVVGGLLGGWLFVEITKTLSGIHTRTGDVLVLPLCAGIAVGRIGCLLAGLTDNTYGNPTSLPWGVNFGDNISRHPTQAYEILFLALLSLVVYYLQSRSHPNGSLFRIFLASYLTWRLLIDFLKPEPPIAGLDIVQWACTFGLAAIAASWKATPNNTGRKHLA